MNKGGASAKDIYELMDKVRHAVYDSSGISLAPEIILLPAGLKIEDKGPKVHGNAVFANSPDVAEKMEK